MSFLAPAWLLLGALAAVPLLLHLMRRRIGMRIEFPAVRYLLRAEKEHSRRLRLNNLLLMLLRVLAVLALALAAARPVARVGGSGHGPTALAIVLDNSLSTTVVVDGRTVFETLRDAARAALAEATDADRVWLVTADGRVAGGTRASLETLLGRMEALGGRGDLQAAVARGASLVAAAGLPNRRIAIVTDGQASSWTEVERLGDVGVAVFAPGKLAPRNHAVTDVRASPARWTPGGAITMRVSGGDTSVYRLAVGTSPTQLRTLARGSARQDEEVVVHATPPERGWIAGLAELQPDELRGDDARWFATWVGAAPRVAIDASAGPFVRTAVEALVSTGRAQAGSDVTIASADAATRLPALLFAPAEPVRLGAANRTLERLGIPWRFASARRGEAAVRGDRFDAVTVTSRYALQPMNGAVAETLATAAGEPWVVAGPGYVLVGSAVDPSSTSLPVRAGFLPWLGDALAQRLSGDAGVIVTATPGSRVRKPPGAQTLEIPGEAARVLGGDTLTAPVRAGVYFFRKGTDRVGALVVNVEPGESQLGRLAPKDLAGRIRAHDVSVESDAGRFARGAFSSGGGRPIDTALILIAIAALLVELVVSRRGERGVALPNAA